MAIHVPVGLLPCLTDVFVKLDVVLKTFAVEAGSLSSEWPRFSSCSLGTCADGRLLCHVRATQVSGIGSLLANDRVG